MLARSQPADAYREANFDARLMGGSRDDLVIFCIEDLIANLGALEIAEARGDRAARSKAITRCVTALTALELGIDRDAAMAANLLQFYGAAKVSLLDSVRETDLANIAAMKQDFREIATAMQATKFA
ncbi:flagellar protein FliS [Qipengyuania sp. SM2507]